MSNVQVNKLFAASIACVATYALFIIVKDINQIHQSAAAFFDQESSIYPAAITFITALVPVSIAAIGYMVYSNKRNYFILIPVLHIILLFSSYTVYGMVVLLLIWWFSKYALKTT